MTFDAAKHPRAQTGPNTGQFAEKHFPEPDVSVGAGPSAEDLAARTERAQRLRERTEAARDLLLDLQLDEQRLALKDIGEGLKALYPTARYLNITKNYESSDGYWIQSVTDAGGNTLAQDDLDIFDGKTPLSETRLYDGGPDVQEAVSHLGRRSVRWMEGVTDDDGEAASLGQADDDVSIDLDKAAALDPGEERSPLDASIAGEEERKLVREAIDDATYHLDDILSEQAGDYGKSDLEDIQERLDAMARFTGE